MAESLDRRAYDLLRLIADHEPIGSIRLVELMHRHGYSVKGRTVRLVLSDLDERGLTEKVSGKGRRLTEAGQVELDRGDLHGRREQVRARIATLISQVTYDPIEDGGGLIAGSATVPESVIGEVRDALESIADTPLAPVPVATERTAAKLRLSVPSSLTLDGVLLTHGISADLKTAGIAEYRPVPPDTAGNATAANHGGEIRRYTDAISGEDSTIDVIDLLIDARRTTIDRLGCDRTVLIVVDNREVPLARYEETRDLAAKTCANLGGVLDLRRPRESGPFPLETPAWDFASLTYGAGEIALSLLVERGLVTSWETLTGIIPRSEFEPHAVALKGQ